VRFFTGLHQPSDAKHFTTPVCISVNRLRPFRSFAVSSDWIMDSGAFSELKLHGGYRHPAAEYAKEVLRWSQTGNLLAAVSQDYMCESFMLARTGLTVDAHQRLSVERYDDLLQHETNCYILPVLQGYRPDEYVRHLDLYGPRLSLGQWVGVGSVCKRNGKVQSVLDVLEAIHAARPDLRLHGFGLKTTALASPLVRALLESADSMAWSYAARREGRNQNDWREAVAWTERITQRF
jgi:hypothetical protein